MRSEINSDVLLQAVCSNPRKVTMFYDFNHEDNSIPYFFLRGKTPEILQENDYKAIGIEIFKEYQSFVDLYYNGTISRSDFIGNLPELKGGETAKHYIADIVDKYKTLGIAVKCIDSIRFSASKYDNTLGFIERLEDDGLIPVFTAGQLAEVVDMSLRNSRIESNKGYFAEIKSQLTEIETEYNSNPTAFINKHSLEIANYNSASPPKFADLDVGNIHAAFTQKFTELRVSYDKEVADNIAEAQKEAGGKIAVLYGAAHGLSYNEGKTIPRYAKKDLDGYLESLGLKPNIIGLIPNSEYIETELQGLAEIPNTFILTNVITDEANVDTSPCEVLQLSEKMLVRSRPAANSIRTESVRRENSRDLATKDVFSPLAETLDMGASPDIQLKAMAWKALSPMQLEQLKSKQEVVK